MGSAMRGSSLAGCGRRWQRPQLEVVGVVAMQVAVVDGAMAGRRWLRVVGRRRGRRTDLGIGIREGFG